MSRTGYHLGFSSSMRRVPPPLGIMVVPDTGVLQMIASQIADRWIYGSSEIVNRGRNDYYFTGKGDFAKIVVNLGADFKIPYIHFTATTVKRLERTIRDLSLPFDKEKVETVGNENLIT